jgi:hypothetical protein
MNDFNILLKYFKRLGYPNKNLLNLFESLDYDEEDFLADLVAKIDEDGANDFTMRAINKLSDGDKGIKVIVNEGAYDEYAYIKIHDTIVDLDNDDTTVLVTWSWGDSRILSVNEDEEEIYVTVQQLYEDAGMGDMGDLEDLLDRIKDDCSKLVYENCGFGLWYDSFIK